MQGCMGLAEIAFGGEASVARIEANVLKSSEAIILELARKDAAIPGDRLVFPRRRSLCSSGVPVRLQHQARKTSSSAALITLVAKDLSETVTVVLSVSPDVEAMLLSFLASARSTKSKGLSSASFYGAKKPAPAAAVSGLISAPPSPVKAVEEAEVGPIVESYFGTQLKAIDWLKKAIAGMEHAQPSPVSSTTSSPLSAALTSTHSSPHTPLRVVTYESAFTGQRRFAVVSSSRLASIIHEGYVKGEYRHCYEIILDKTPCRPYFDLEFDRSTNKHLSTPQAIDRLLHKVICAIISCFYHVFGVLIDRKHILLLDSSTPKVGFHCTDT